MANIGFDLDGVIIDHTKNKIKKVKEFGIALTAEQTPHDSIKSFLPRDQYREMQRYIYNEASMHAPPVKGALATIARMSRTHTLFIISRREDNPYGWEWLNAHGIFAYIPKERIFFVPHDVPYSKNAAAEKQKITHFLDDEIDILREMPSVATKFHFDPHGSAPDSEFVKIKKWQELPAIIKNF